MKAPADVAFWDAQADRYGRQEGLERRAIATALRIAGARPEDRVVDLATGTGIILRALAAAPAPPRTVTGIDRSARMLAQIGPLPAGWTTLVADAAAVPLPDGSADLVICAYLLHLLSAAERLAVLTEIRRLLRSAEDSRLVVVTPWSDRRRLGGRVVHHALVSAARARPASWGGLMPLDPTPDLEAAGLRCERRVQLPRGGYPSLVLRAALGR